MTYQWFSSADGYKNAIGGGASHLLLQSDEGYQIKVVATATNGNAVTISATSTATAIVKDIKPAVAVYISGLAQDGNTLTAVATLNDADAVVAYQWQAYVGGFWTTIPAQSASTYLVTEANEGEKLRVVAHSTDPDAGSATATSVATAIVTDPPPQLSIASHSLNLPKGGLVAMGVSVASADSDDTVLVKITGLKSYEYITDGLDSTKFTGSSVTLTAAEVNKGLTLHSTYGGKSTVVNTLTLVASNTTSGEAVNSAPQAITVTDPPTASTSSVALLAQFMAASGVSGTAVSNESWTPHAADLSLSLPTH